MAFKSPTTDLRIARRSRAKSGQLTLWTGQNHAGGIEAFKKCLALPTPPDEPGPALIQLWIGQLHEGLGDKTAAREAYRATLALDPNFQPATDALRKLD